MILASGLVALATAFAQVPDALAAMVDADDVAGLRAGLQRDDVRGKELRDVLWHVHARVHALRRAGRCSEAVAWLSLIEAEAARAEETIQLQLYAAGERIEIALTRGAPDLAAPAHELLVE